MLSYGAFIKCSARPSRIYMGAMAISPITFGAPHRPDKRSLEFSRSLQSMAAKQRKNALHINLILLMVFGGLAIWTEIDKLKRRHKISSADVK
jgi:hypothetical protein